jgi:hypothetical protein
MAKRNFRLTVHFYIGAAHPASMRQRQRTSYPTRERAEYELKRWRGNSHLTIVAAYIGERA